MSKGKTMVRGALLSTAGMIASMAGSLIAAVIFGRVLPESEVGLFWLLILLSDALLVLSNFGLQNALPKLIADAPDTERAVMGAGILLIQGALSLAVGLVLLAFWILLPDPRMVSSSGTWLSLYPYLWALPLLCFMATQRDTALAILAGMNRYADRAVGLIVGAAVQVVLVAVIIAWLKQGLLALTLCTFVSYFAAAAWVTFRVGHSRAGPGMWSSYVHAVRFSAPLYLNNLLGFAFQRIDTLLVAMLMGSPTQVAYFEMAKRLPNMFARVLSAALVPYLPGLSSRLANNDYPGATRLLNKTFGLVAFLGYTSVLTVMVIQRPLIVILFSERYLPCLDILWLLLTGACLALQTGILGLSLVAAGHPASVTRANIVTAGVSLAVNCAVIPRFGVTGAAWAFVAATSVSTILQGLALYRCELRLTWRSVLAPHAAVFFSLLLSQYGNVAAARILALLLFVIVCLGTSVVTPRDLVYLRRNIYSEHGTTAG